MGWWSTCIMGGDTPYDVAAVVDDLLGTRFDRMHMPGDWTPQEQQLVRERIDRYGVERLADDLLKALPGFRPDVPLQVLGLLVISSGARLSEAVRQRVLAACNQDEWAREERERAARIRELRETVRSYADTPVALRQTGLLERLCGGDEPDRGEPSA